MPKTIKNQPPCILYPTLPTDIEHFAAGVVHPIMKEVITDYRKLMNDSATRKIWTTAFGKELGGLAQGDNKTKEPGSDTLVFLTHDEIANIPTDCTVTYARIVVNYCPQKASPDRVPITMGRNLINYPGELTTQTANITTTKIMWNSIISTPGALYACIDLQIYYLGTPLDRYEYMRIPNALIPQHFIQQYQLHEKAKMDMCIWKLEEECMAYLKLEFLPINY